MDKQEKYKYKGRDRIRLDVFLAGSSGLTRSRISRLIRDGLVLVNDNIMTRTSYILRGGEKIIINIPSPEPPIPEAEDIPLDILYEDSDLIIINKPRGMSVHPGAGRSSGTLVSALLNHCSDLSGIGGIIRPGIVHRLDKDTSGVLVVAKNDKTHLILSKQFSGRTVEKQYLALVKGRPVQKEMIIDAPLGRSSSNRKKFTVRPDGKNAVTLIRQKELLGEYTLLEIRPRTGRTHQIRAHLAWLNLHVIGDPLYGRGKNPWKLKGQFLHAKRIVFKHPADGRIMDFTASLPEELRVILKDLRSKFLEGNS